VSNNLPCMYVTEDTIRTDPDTVKRLYTTAVQNGAHAVVLCDTVGHATPQGAYNLVQFVIREVVKPSGEKIRVDWHGHNDRCLAQIIEIGPLSGKSNVLFWLERHKISADDAVVSRILDAAKNSARVLTDAELHALCAGAPAH